MPASILVDVQEGPSRESIDEQAHAAGGGRTGISIVPEVIEFSRRAQDLPPFGGLFIADHGAEGNHVRR